MNKIVMTLVTLIANNCLAIYCEFSVKNFEKQTIESGSIQNDGRIEIGGFVGSYTFNAKDNLEILSITAPNGTSVATQYTFGLLPKMTVELTADNGDIASLICIR